MTEPTSHVEQQVAARIQAAKVRVQAAKQRRDDLAAARKRGLAHRHARKLKNLAEAEQRQAEEDGAQGLDQPEPRLHMVQAPEVLDHDETDQGGGAA